MNKILKASFSGSKTIQLTALKTIGRLLMILAVLITAIFVIVHHRAAAAGNSSDYRPVNSLPVSAAPLDGNLFILRNCTGLTIDKQASPTTYSNVGDVINYTYLVKNSSNETLEEPVTVTDDKIPVSCPPGDLAPGATITCTASYLITQADLDLGSVTNTAFASANDMTSDSDEETVVASQMPSLSLVKTATPATYSNVADVINYSYLVKNTGNVTLAGPVTVTDDKVPVSCPSGGLVPGATLTCSASYSITQADLESGSVTNTAFASANGITSNTDDETVNRIKLPQTINFTSSAPEDATVGGTTYIPSALATSGLPVTITVDPAASSVCAISNGIVSFIDVGTCILDANQEGNLIYDAAPQVQQSFVVGSRHWLIYVPMVFPPITINPPVPLLP
jgi:uncharacterized repeat protein (TIGR01451 family)